MNKNYHVARYFCDQRLYYHENLQNFGPQSTVSLETLFPSLPPYSPLLGSTSPNVNNPASAGLLPFHTDPSHLSRGHTHTSFLPTDPSHLNSNPLLSEHARFYEGEVLQRTTDFLDIVDDCMCVQIQGSVERPRMFPHKLY